ncbi:PIG-L deacetylase family protein [Nitrospira sp. BLG_1]|uniref:PIG-L deacetylase family protein n=1 Tax=Nitrospira sp. BLG_1 TaxID=3395883 RepID=UPI0039BD381B
MKTSFPIQLARRGLNILCIGAHADDIEIGCGGTILKLLQTHPGSRVAWVVLTARGDRKKEAMKSAAAFLPGAGSTKIITKSFRESYLPYQGKEVKEYFDTLPRVIDPDLIFTHYRHDLHQDHRVVCELTWNTYRRHQILEYEIPKYDGDLGQPNLYVPLTDDLGREKVRLLMEGFATQRSKRWFTEDIFYGLLRIRGIESPKLTRYAEAFYARKVAIE